MLGGGKIDYERGNSTTNFAGMAIIQIANAGLAAALPVPDPSVFYACTDSIKATFGYLYTTTGAERPKT